jgi:hypothetical protein
MHLCLLAKIYGELAAVILSSITQERWNEYTGANTLHILDLDYVTLETKPNVAWCSTKKSVLSGEASFEKLTFCAWPCNIFTIIFLWRYHLCSFIKGYSTNTLLRYNQTVRTNFEKITISCSSAHLVGHYFWSRNFKIHWALSRMDQVLIA